MTRAKGVTVILVRRTVVYYVYNVHCTVLYDPQGADVTHRDNEGLCALHWAVLRGHLDAVRLLLSRGATANNIACRRRRRETEEGIEVRQFTPLGG